MKKLNYHTGKTLKLTNVLKNKILLSDENFNLNTTVEQMQSYIRTHGALSMAWNTPIRWNRSSVCRMPCTAGIWGRSRA